MIERAQYATMDRTKINIVLAGETITIAAQPGLYWFELLKSSAVEIADYQPTADDVRAEAQRRIMAFVGAVTIDACIVRQLNANMRANDLNDIRHDREWTEAEATEGAALRRMATAIKAIRMSSNAMESSPPADYADDRHWQT